MITRNRSWENVLFVVFDCQKCAIPRSSNRKQIASDDGEYTFCCVSFLAPKWACHLRSQFSLANESVASELPNFLFTFEAVGAR